MPEPPAPEAPEAPASCFASVGKQTGTESGVHIDIGIRADQTLDDLSSQYRFYDADMNLVYTGERAQARTLSGGRAIFFRKREHGIEVLGIEYVTTRWRMAVESGRIMARPARRGR